MFERSNVPVRITNVHPLNMEKDDAELTLLKIDCAIEPFTAELAKELDNDVRTALYTRTDAEIKRKMTSIGWDLGIPSQRIEMRMAPDQALESFTLGEAKVSNLKTTRSGKSTAWRLTFSLTCHPASEHMSAHIIESYMKTRYCNFEATQPDLFSASTKERTRAVRAEQEQGIGLETTSH